MAAAGRRGRGLRTPDREIPNHSPGPSGFTGSRNAMTASSIASPPYHSAGNASIPATGTVQRRFVRAPQTTSAIANGSRTRNGIGTAAHVPSRPAIRVSTSTHSNHASGRSRTTRPRSAPSPPARWTAAATRPRTTNHSSPMPGVIFVSSTSAQVAGQRNPSTIAAARSRWMLPPASSIRPRTTPDGEPLAAGEHEHGPSRIPVQTAMKACHGSARIGSRSCRNAGE